MANNYQRSKSPSPQRDSILADQSRGKFSDPDSLFTAFDIEEQRRAVDNALQYAREVKQRNQDDLHYYVAQQENVIKSQLEWHRKFTLSFACFIFFFIGAPLGAIIRKGGLGMPVVDFRAFVYHLLYYFDDGRKVGQGGCYLSGCRDVDFCLYSVAFGNYTDLQVRDRFRDDEYRSLHKSL